MRALVNHCSGCLSTGIAPSRPGGADRHTHCAGDLHRLRRERRYPAHGRLQRLETDPEAPIVARADYAIIEI